MKPSDSDPPPAAASAAKQAVAEWLRDHGDAVYAYALSRVESQHVTEELVQETFLAALTQFDRFQQKSSPKTWLIAILRNKIIEHYRKRNRQRQQSLEDACSATFDQRGVWRLPVGNWPRQPEQHFQDQEFWQAFVACLGKLPASTADVFMLRVLDGWETDKICKTLKISSTNMSVRLHRARLQLRNCLEENWFGDD